MPDSPEISDLVGRVSADLKAIVADEIALAKAEIKPAVKAVGLGGGLLAGAGYFAVSATIVAWLTMAAGFAWLYAATTPLSPWACVFLGTLTAVVALLVIAGLLALAAKRSFARAHGPTKAPQGLSQAMQAISDGVRSGNQRVAALIKPADHTNRPDWVPTPPDSWRDEGPAS
jgi:hypothetical protein